MPQVGQDYPTGTIVQWLKKEGDSVKKGDAVLRVESEKATFDVEAEESGILLKILHREGEEVEILKSVGFIGRQDEIGEKI
jgi:dihydrolipoamide dehydrogenase